MAELDLNLMNLSLDINLEDRANHNASDSSERSFQDASAMDILQQYIACIRCLAIFDPSCSIMGPVIDVISDYVK